MPSYTETWVNGAVFVPGDYGTEHLAQVDGKSWTDIYGHKAGHRAAFVMKDNRVNFFHAPIPVSFGFKLDPTTGGKGDPVSPQLKEVRVEFDWDPAGVNRPRLTQVWVHAGITVLASGRTDFKIENIGGVNICTLADINKFVTRGICVSIGFSTEGLGQSALYFRGAGAAFELPA
jgi:hypothetical protein